MKKYIILFALSAAAIAWTLLIPLGVENSYMPVNAFCASTGKSVTTVDCAGTIEAAVKQQIVLGRQVKISRNNFNIGDTVKKGDKLLEIDKDTTMQLLTANSVSTNNQSSSESSEVSKSQATNALKSALNSGFIGKGTYDSLMNQLNNSQTNKISIPAANAVPSNSGEDSEQIMESIENGLKAPISGVITQVVDGVSGISSAGTVLAEVADMGSLQVKAQIGENVIKNIKIGQKAEFTGTGFDGKFEGTVKKIYPVAENGSNQAGTGNTVGLIIAIDKPTQDLRPGLAVSVKINVSEHSGVVKLPYEAVKQDDNGTEYVYIFKDGQAVRKNIETGEEDDKSIEVLEGIKAGDVVIENTQDADLSGKKIRVSN